MQRKFFSENIKQIKIGYFFTAGLFTAFVLVIFLITSIHENPIEKELASIILFVTIVIAPLYIIMLGFFVWYWGNSLISKAFNIKPFSELDKIGFEKKIFNRESKWKLTELKYVGKIRKFTVHGYLDAQFDKKHIKFMFMTGQYKIDKKEFKRLFKLLKSNNMFFDNGAITKEYHKKKSGLKSIEQLEKELIEASELIERIGIKPI